jgi:hypothetical protein
MCCFNFLVATALRSAPLVVVSPGAPLQRTRSDGQAFKPAREARRSPEFAADTAAFTVWVL